MVQWLSYKIKSSVNIPVISGAPLYPQTEELQNYGARFFSVCVIFCLESLFYSFRFKCRIYQLGP